MEQVENGFLENPKVYSVSKERESSKRGQECGNVAPRMVHGNEMMWQPQECPTEDSLQGSTCSEEYN